MRKGEIQQVFVYLMVVLVAGVVILIGYSSISSIIDSSADVQEARLRSSLESEFNRVTFRSFRTVDLSVPSGIESLCFVDSMAAVDRDEHPFIYEELQAGTGYTVFLVKGDSFMPFIAHDNLVVSNEVFCANVSRGTASFVLTGLGRDRIGVGAERVPPVNVHFRGFTQDSVEFSVTMDVNDRVQFSLPGDVPYVIRLFDYTEDNATFVVRNLASGDKFGPHTINEGEEWRIDEISLVIKLDVISSAVITVSSEKGFEPDEVTDSCRGVVDETVQGRIIVYFEDLDPGWITSTPENLAMRWWERTDPNFVGPVPVSIPTGDYRVTLYTYDGHSLRTQQDQRDERWFARLMSGTTNVVDSSSSIDLPVRYGYVFQADVVDESLRVPSNVNRVYAWHAYIPSTYDPVRDNPNSLYPLCAVFDPVSDDLPPVDDFNKRRIQPYSENPYYWQYKEKPIILLGSGRDHNLFNFYDFNDVRSYLDRLVENGGNYVRQVMDELTQYQYHERDNVPPYIKNENGLFDLDQFNPEYWRRFEDSLKLANERDVIVSIEVWSTWWFYGADNEHNRWNNANPFNPKNNVNYNAVASGLPEYWNCYPYRDGNSKQVFNDESPCGKEVDWHPFFRTVHHPNNIMSELVYNYQKEWVDKILSYSLNYDNVIYVMHNEVSVDSRGDAWKWGAYWADYIKRQAELKGKKVETTDMFNEWDIKSERHDVLYDYPLIYTFIEVSQGNQQKGDVHWDNLQGRRGQIKNSPRPINNVKIYGTDDSNYMFNVNMQEGEENFWRNIMGGAASARFHRLPHGLGISDSAMAHLNSARKFLDEYDIFTGRPCNDLLSSRSTNEAFANCNPGNSYAVYFPNGGSVGLNLASGSYSLKWFNIKDGSWQSQSTVTGGQVRTLAAPGSGHWVVVIQ